MTIESWNHWRAKFREFARTFKNCAKIMRMFGECAEHCQNVCVRPNIRSFLDAERFYSVKTGKSCFGESLHSKKLLTLLKMCYISPV